MKRLLIIILILSAGIMYSVPSISQNCSTVYGAGWNYSGSSDGVQSYNYTTNTWTGSSLESLSYFTGSNTINKGGPIAIDPLNQNINFVTDANNVAAIYLFGNAPTFVTFPSNLSNVTSQLLCSGYKPSSHLCYYMSQNFLSSLPTAGNTGFFSIDFTNLDSPVAKSYSPILTSGSPYVNTTQGGDLCFDAHGVCYLVTAAKQLFTIVTDEVANTATFTQIAVLNALSFAPTAIAFDPMTPAALTITGGTSPVYANYDLANNSTVILTNNAGWNAGDLASCYFPDLAPNLNVTKSVYDVTQISAPPVLISSGDILRYTIVVKNTGNVNAGNFMLADTLPAGVTYVPGSTTLNGVAIPDGSGNSFPFSTPATANSSDQTYGSGILTTYATAGNPTAILQYEVKVSGTVGMNITNSATATATGNDGITTFTGSGNVAFTIQPLTGLPIDLINFSASGYNTSVKLQWQTTGEINNGNFIIEKSGNGTNFTSIGSVNMATTDSQNVESYQFIDPNPLNGINFYRLQQTDQTGKIIYSEIRLVQFDISNAGTVKLYPNPAKTGQVITLTTSQPYQQLTVKLNNQLGQEEWQNNYSNVKSQVSLILGSTPKGIYYVTIWGDNKLVQTTKLIIE